MMVDIFSYKIMINRIFMFTLTVTVLSVKLSQTEIFWSLIAVVVVVVASSSFCDPPIDVSVCFSCLVCRDFIAPSVILLVLGGFLGEHRTPIFSLNEAFLATTPLAEGDLFIGNLSS